MFLAKLHRDSDVAYLASGLYDVITQPMRVRAGYLPGSQKPVAFIQESIMLFWELLEINKVFPIFCGANNFFRHFLIM